MEEKIQTYYETPATTVVEVKTEGVICSVSGLTDYTEGTDPFNS